MKINQTITFFLFFLIFFSAANAEAEIVKGEKFEGEEITYAYKLEKKADQFFIVKQPLCIELQEEIKITKTRKKRAAEVASVILAPTVFVTPHISYFALQRANVALDEKDKKQHQGDVMTDRIILCGKQEPGSGEKLIIQTSGMKIIKDIVTDSNGAFDLKSIVKKAGDEIYFNIFVKKKDSVFYVSTIYL